MIKVSIIIPVYNCRSAIKRCLDSVVNQTYKNIEIILVNDGSCDNSGKICDEYKSADKRIKLIHQKNQGVSIARNNAIAQSTGDYIMFLDGDDAIDKNTVEVSVNESENGKWDIVNFGYHMYLEGKNNVVFQNDITYKSCTLKTPDDIKENFVNCYKNGVFDFVTDKMIRASLIKNNKLSFRSEFNIGGEDAMFIMDLIPYVSNIKITDCAFYCYYRREDLSMTKTFHPDKFYRYCDRIRKLSSLMEKFNCYDNEYLTVLYGTYFLWSYESLFLKSCRMDMRERYRYILNTYSKTDAVSMERAIIKRIIEDKNSFNDYSNSSKIALNLFLKKRIHILAIWHILTVLKGTHQ